MKVQIKIISPLGEFSGDLQETNEKDIERLKIVGEDLYKATHFSITQGSKVIYFPADVIRNSIYIIDVTP